MDGPEPDNYAIYPSLEGKQLSYSFIIKDYEGKGAFTNDQKRILHEKFGLLDVHVETLSIYVGNCLDIGSLNNLSKVTRPKAIEKGRKQVKKARLRLRSGADPETVKDMLAGLSTCFAASAQDAKLLPIALSNDGDLEDQLTQILATPGSVAALEPDDKRFTSDLRGYRVVESCCYIWGDAGKKLTFSTNEIRTNSRGGPFMEYIQKVTSFVTDPSQELSANTIFADIELFKEKMNQPDFMTEEPEFG